MNAIPSTHGWDWSAFQGSRRCLELNRRGLQAIDWLLPWLSQRRVVVQAGGNLGIFPKRFSELFGVVYTFEPAPDLFACVVHNAPEVNIVKLQAALGYTRGLVGLSRKRLDSKLLPPHEGLTHVSGKGIVPVLRIDDLGLSVCDLIYLDIESYESAALQGAIETMATCRPVIVVEMHAETVCRAGLTMQGLRDQIISYGYKSVVQLMSDEVFQPVAA